MKTMQQQHWALELVLIKGHMSTADQLFLQHKKTISLDWQHWCFFLTFFQDLSAYISDTSKSDCFVENVIQSLNILEICLRKHGLMLDNNYIWSWKKVNFPK